MRRRRWTWVAGLSASITASCILLFARSRDQLAILASSIPLEVIQAHQVGQRPKINFSVPLIGRITYPQDLSGLPFSLDTGTLDHGTKEWPINPKTSAGAIYIAGKSPMPFFIEFGQPQVSTWSFGNSRVETTFSHVMNTGYLECPLVFGSRSREVDLSTESLSSGQVNARLSLPPSGIPEPALPRLTTSLGSWTVRMEPKPWISPMFPIHYDVAVDDRNASLFLVSVSRPSEKYGFSQLLCTPDRAATVDFDSWYRGEQLPVRVRLTVRRIAGVPTQFVMKRGTLNGWLCLKAVGPKGVVYASAFGYSCPKDVACVRIGDEWSALPESYDGGYPPVRQRACLKMFQDGQVVDGIIYKTVELREVVLPMGLPDIRKYRGQVAGSR